MKLKVNDQVLVISGKDRNKTGKIIEIDRKNDKVKVEQVNMRTKHIKKTANQAGQKITYEGFLNASNVMILDPKTAKPTRVAYKKLATGKKERISKVSQSSLDTITTEAKSKKKVKA